MKRYVIECPARCVVTHGCQEHAGQDWRASKRLPVGMGYLRAYVAYKRHSRKYPKSGPYRLIKEAS